LELFSLLRRALLALIICTGIIGSAANATLYDNRIKPSGLVDDLRLGRISNEQFVATITQRKATIVASCDLVLWIEMEADEIALRRYYAITVPANSTRPPPSAAIGIALSDIVEECRPATRYFGQAIEAANGCYLETAFDHVSRLRAIANNYAVQQKRMLALGGFGRVALGRASDYAGQSKSSFETALAAYNKARTDCPQKKPAPPPAAAPADAAPIDSCTATGGNRPNPACAAAAPLLGRWRNKKYGGVVELRMEGDGTITGIIVTDSEQMRGYGYRAGMPILRRLKMAPPSSIWSSYATGGQYFSAAMPGRKAGEQYGEAYWDEPALINIHRDRPNRLDLPATLGGRLGRYELWERN
jgi:hypothetical protein